MICGSPDQTEFVIFSLLILQCSLGVRPPLIATVFETALILECGKEKVKVSSLFKYFLCCHAPDLTSRYP